MGKFQLTVTTHFAGAHYLRGYDGPCERMHGHNFRVEARVSGSKLDEVGMVVDFKTIKAEMKQIIGRFDHRVANDVAPFDTENPTAENMARHIFEALAPRIEAHGASLEAVGIWETDSYGVIYAPES